MPHFALLDADRRIVNVVALARREDILTTVSHGDGDEAAPVFVGSDAHLRAHGAADAVEITDDTGPARVGMIFADSKFVPGPAPLTDADNADLIAEAQRRGLLAQPGRA